MSLKNLNEALENIYGLGKNKLTEAAASDFSIQGDTLVLYSGNDTEIVVPSGIKKIASIAFAGHDKIKKIVLPEGIEEIERRAFEYCSELEEINLPKSLTQIGYGAFKACKSLKSIIIPEKIAIIETDTFSQCTALESVFFSGPIKDIKKGAFEETKALTRVELPEGVEQIGIQAFAFSGLMEIALPNTLKTIWDFAFEYCIHLGPSIVIPESVKELRPNIFCDCVSLKNVTILNENINICAEAFAKCSKDLTVFCTEGSRVEQYCIEHNIAVETGKISSNMYKKLFKIGGMTPQQIADLDKICSQAGVQISVQLLGISPEAVMISIYPSVGNKNFYLSTISALLIFLKKLDACLAAGIVEASSPSEVDQIGAVLQKKETQ